MSGDNAIASLWLKDYLTAWDVYEHGISRILLHQRTAFQDLMIVELENSHKALILDGLWQSCTRDEFLYHEPLVHPAFLTHQAPKNVLVLGGGEGATVREILRWKTVERVVMVDIDGDVVAACRHWLPEMHAGVFDDPRVEVVIGDALDYVANAVPEWDVIISDLSEPIEQGPSFALFTQEFFAQLNQLLTPGGVLVVQGGSVAIANLTFHARLANTLQTVFPHVLSYTSTIPTFGEPWGFLLCRQTPMNRRPDPDAIDQLLATHTTGGCRCIDGIAYLGLCQTPLYVRDAIAQTTEVYTRDRPARYPNAQGILEG
ncbi:spermidine synthase [Spirulina major]|uniref:spermine/spermidine synthase domain-containing protein n=1 Tax=Spirulina major TaxID=270636 RepID=UPI000934F454|nr:spermidine synthase [Spirulina major]